MEELDTHGRTVREAEEIFFEYLNRVRLKGELRPVRFITGVGVVQNRLRALAAEHDLNHFVEMGNAGVLVIEFE